MGGVDYCSLIDAHASNPSIYLPEQNERRRGTGRGNWWPTRSWTWGTTGRTCIGTCGPWRRWSSARSCHWVSKGPYGWVGSRFLLLSLYLSMYSCLPLLLVAPVGHDPTLPINHPPPTHTKPQGKRRGADRGMGRRQESRGRGRQGQAVGDHARGGLERRPAHGVLQVGGGWVGGWVVHSVLQRLTHPHII